jgi:hypothetical protein
MPGETPLERHDALLDADETWRDAELVKALKDGHPIQGEGRARIIEWYEAATTLAAERARQADPVGLREALIEAERALNRMVPSLASTSRVHDDYRIIRDALRLASLPAQPVEPGPLDVERLARAWWKCVNEPEEGPWEDASDTDIDNANGWAMALAAEYSRLGEDGRD